MNNLKTYRERAGLTLNELSNKIGASCAMISYVERGLRDFTGQVWKKIAKVLDCSLDELLNAR